MRLRRYGPSALLVELDSAAEVRAVHGQLKLAREQGRLDLVELVPAARTVLVTVRPGSGLAEVRAVLAAVDLTGAPLPLGRSVIVPVSYDGADLELVARAAGLSEAEVVALHTGSEYTVAFCGFSPGFGYLTGLPEPLRQPRLATARARVPAGSVGIAGEFTGVYPSATPGGWRVLGRTQLVMFDPAADPPATLAPGDLVRFKAVS